MISFSGQREFSEVGNGSLAKNVGSRLWYGDLARWRWIRANCLQRGAARLDSRVLLSCDRPKMPGLAGRVPPSLPRRRVLVFVLLLSSKSYAARPLARLVGTLGPVFGFRTLFPGEDYDPVMSPRLCDLPLSLSMSTVVSLARIIVHGYMKGVTISDSAKRIPQGHGHGHSLTRTRSGGGTGRGARPKTMTKPSLFHTTTTRQSTAPSAPPSTIIFLSDGGEQRKRKKHGQRLRQGIREGAAPRGPPPQERQDPLRDAAVLRPVRGVDPVRGGGQLLAVQEPGQVHRRVRHAGERGEGGHRDGELDLVFRSACRTGTAPVVMEKGEPESIAMVRDRTRPTARNDSSRTLTPAPGTQTAPVVMEGEGSQKRMMFMLPAEYDSMDKIPKPTNPKVHIAEVPSEVGVVHRYNG
ncbi:hypothetical protein THAOC_27287, partial [Thalassiosira oceanica]